MKRKDTNKTAAKPECCGSYATCHVESIVSVDERGQMVLPKDLRERAGIAPGDKLVLTSWQVDGDVCCITLVRGQNFGDLVMKQLGPVVNGIRSSR